MPRISLATNLKDVQESQPVPNGKYDLVIGSVEEGNARTSGRPQLVCRINIEGHDNAPLVTHYVSLPSAGDEKAQIKALFLARFLEAFGIAYDEGGFDSDDLIGARASLELTLSEPDESGNVYNRLVLPKLKTERSEQTTGRRSPAPPKR